MNLTFSQSPVVNGAIRSEMAKSEGDDALDVDWEQELEEDLACGETPPAPQPRQQTLPNGVLRGQQEHQPTHLEQQQPQEEEEEEELVFYSSGTRPCLPPVAPATLPTASYATPSPPSSRSPFGVMASGASAVSPLAVVGVVGGSRDTQTDGRMEERELVDRVLDVPEIFQHMCELYPDLIRHPLKS